MRRPVVLALAGAALIGLVYAYMNGAAAKASALLSKLGPHWSNLNAAMKVKALAVIDTLARQGITVGIPSTGGWRSTQDQQNIDPNNTNVVDPRDSYHVWGLAVDFVPIDDNGLFYWPPSADPVWQDIGRAIKAQGLVWGGDFKSITDMPHGELHLDSLADLKDSYEDPQDYVDANA